jgi:hypothetical protein
MNHPHRYKMRFAMPVFAVLAALALGAIVRFLWNAILPALLNVNPISYWQSVGLLVLCRMQKASRGRINTKRARPQAGLFYFFKSIKVILDSIRRSYCTSKT